MCDKKNSVLFTDTECLVLSSDFKLPDARNLVRGLPTKVFTNDTDDAVAAAVQETVAEDVANEAIPYTPTLLILPSPLSHDIPSTSQVQSSPPQ
nr:hypothetical protein [Tanacetum cinerariifolium]